MLPFSNFNDGSLRPPRLRVGHSLWSLEKLPMNAPEWTLEEKVARVKDAGFEHLECHLPTPDARASVPPVVARHGLKLLLVHRASSVEETRDTIEFGASAGAQAIVCQPASTCSALKDVARLVREGARIAADNGLCYFVETHRGCFTESIRQTIELIEEVPEIRLAADFSHYVVGSELYGWELEQELARMRPIIERAAHLHGRISNGEQVQVDVGAGDGGEGTPASFFKQLWAEACQAWRQGAQPGDVLSFSSELGPPRYAVTLPDGREFSDRWEQSLVMKSLAEQAWENPSRNAPSL